MQAWAFARAVHLSCHLLSQYQIPHPELAISLLPQILEDQKKRMWTAAVEQKMKCNMQLVRKSCWKSCRQRSRGLFCTLTFRNQRSSFTAERALIKHWWKDMASIYSSRDTISLRGCVPLRRTLQYELQVAPIPSQTPDLVVGTITQTKNE